MQKEKDSKIVKFSLVLTGLFAFLFMISFVFAADPQAPSSTTFITNETKATSSSGQMVNISGGYVAYMNFSATVQNPRWKAFLGNVEGAFTLDDASGSTIYNWSLSSITGRVYATRTDSTVSWSSITCSNSTILETENVLLNHSNLDDNITATFSDTTHDTFWVGSVSITANSCPTLNTFVDNVTQDNYFEEMALYDTSNVVYATILEESHEGYDGNPYDFQMLVPENGLPSFSGATAYYLYVEIGS